MSGRRIIDPLPCRIARREVARLLGYPPGPLPERVEDIIEEVERQAPLLVQPTGVYSLLENDDFRHSRFLGGVERVALGLVTIGDGVERAVERYREQGLLAPALIFDAFGSAAAEAAADAAEAAIRAGVERDDMRCSRRFSPGYGGWDVGEQRWIIDALTARDVGVTLTDGCMMTPRKSVTFAMTVGVEPVEMRADDICDTCNAPNCDMRGTEQRCERKPIG